MATPSTDLILAVRDNRDLRERLMALASLDGDLGDRAMGWVDQYIYELAAAGVTDSGDTIASVLEYAMASYKPTPRPGQDPSKVTDAHLLHAIEQVKAAHAEAG